MRFLQSFLHARQLSPPLPSPPLMNPSLKIHVASKKKKVYTFFRADPNRSADNSLLLKEALNLIGSVRNRSDPNRAVRTRSLEVPNLRLVWVDEAP